MIFVSSLECSLSHAAVLKLKQFYVDAIALYSIIKSSEADFEILWNTCISSDCIYSYNLKTVSVLHWATLTLHGLNYELKL